MPQAYMLVGGIPGKHDPQNYTQITHVLRTYLCVCVCDSKSVCTQITVLCVISASELELFILAL